MRPAPLAWLVPLLVACGKGASPVDLLTNVERTSRGDTNIIRSSGTGLWGAMTDAVEESRADASANAFGHLAAGAVLPNGGIAVLDEKAPNGPIVKVFNRSGQFLQTVGQVGPGPGGYGAQGVEIAAGDDATIYLWDPDNRRIDRYAPNGRILPSVSVGSLAGGNGQAGLRVGPNGSFYVLSIVRPLQSDTRRVFDVTGYVQYDSAGRARDTVGVQRTWFTRAPVTEFDPAADWTVLADGRVVITRTDRLGFLLKPADGSGSMLWTEVVADPPRLEPQERQELQAIADYGFARSANDTNRSRVRPVVPPNKAMSSRVRVDLDGRIWLQRLVVSVRVPAHVTIPVPPEQPPPPPTHFGEPIVWSAFNEDGAYLGDVRFPIGTRVLGFVRDLAWGVAPGLNGEETLIRFRMPGVPASMPEPRAP